VNEPGRPVHQELRLPIPLRGMKAAVQSESDQNRWDNLSTQTSTHLSCDDIRDLAVSVLEDTKAEDLQVFDLRSRNTFADYMIIASGRSTRQVKAMADKLVIRSKQAGNPPLGVEGEKGAEWVLVDLNDVVIHLMVPQTRAFYNLEKLWSMPPASRSAHSGA